MEGQQQMRSLGTGSLYKGLMAVDRKEGEPKGAPGERKGARGSTQEQGGAKGGHRSKDSLQTSTQQQEDPAHLNRGN